MDMKTAHVEIPWCGAVVKGLYSESIHLKFKSFLLQYHAVSAQADYFISLCLSPFTG